MKHPSAPGQEAHPDKLTDWRISSLISSKHYLPAGYVSNIWTWCVCACVWMLYVREGSKSL